MQPRVLRRSAGFASVLVFVAASSALAALPSAIGNTPPQVTVPADFTAEADTYGGWTVAYAASAIDAEDGPLPVSCSAAIGSVLPVTTTTVTCTATDLTGVDGTASFDVTVVDTTAPALEGLPGDLWYDTPDPLGAMVGWWSPIATDIVDGELPVSCQPAAGSMFPLGTTQVTCSASDSAGNVVSGSFNVLITILDFTPPQITGVSGDLFVETEDPDGIAVSYDTGFAEDNIDGLVPVLCTPPSGSVFPVGTTTVTCSATDAAGNASSTEFLVEVALVDRTPPVLSGLPDDIDVESADPAGMTVTWSGPSAVDAVDGPVTVTCTPASGSFFSTGTATVTCRATDAAGNVAWGSFDVRVTFVDRVPPTMTDVPSGIHVETNDPDGRVVTWSGPSAVDDIDGPVDVTCSPASGSHFDTGSTVVTCTATDAAGNRTTDAFTVGVTYVDQTAPTLSGIPADIALDTGDPTGRNVSWTAPSAMDDADGRVPVVCAPASGSRFRVGTTTVSCTATDSAGNAASDSFHVRISLVDRVPPTITGVPADMIVRLAPGARIAVTWDMPSAVDDVDGPVPVSCNPASGSAFAVGATTVRCSASDSAGNVATASFTVTVMASDPEPVAGLDVAWAKPVGDAEQITAKLGKTLELRARITVDGTVVGKRGGKPRLVIERLDACGGTVVERIDGGAMRWKDNRWTVDVKTKKLGLGCWRLSIALGNAEGGAFDLAVWQKPKHESDKKDKHEERDRV